MASDLCEHASRDPACPYCEIDRLRSRLAEAERLLREVEWSAWKSNYGVACCIECAGEEPTHAPDCALARWLEGGGR